MGVAQDVYDRVYGKPLVRQQVETHRRVVFRDLRADEMPEQEDDSIDYVYFIDATCASSDDEIKDED